MSYYTAVISLVWMALAVLTVLVSENERISKEDRKVLYVTYGLVAASALAEWLGVQFSGNPEISIGLIRFVKCLDFILTPLAGRLLVRQLQIKNKISTIMTGLIIFNTAFQAVSLFTDWMITVDPVTHVYAHGKFYLVYVIECSVNLILVIAQFMIYGRSYRKSNRFSLYAILIMVLVGILFQEVGNGDVRTDYIAIVFGLLFLYIHFNGYSQQSSDDQIRQQEITITTDALTGLKSRYAYAETIKEFGEAMPEDLTAFSIDINGLKEVNDTLGHEAGDELLRGAGKCIKAVFKDNAYRVGGDEFIALLPVLSEDAAIAAKNRVKVETNRWHGEYVYELSLSVGFALSAQHPDASVEELVREADMQMYAAKDEYYLKAGKKRRLT